MSKLRRLALPLEIKAVDSSERIIEGYAAVFSNLDKNGDVIAPGAFDETLAGRAVSDVAVFIGHDMGSLPIGTPLEIRADGKGLYTRTKVFPTHQGDDLLATAKSLMAVGQPLGMSIGFRTKDADWTAIDGQQVRQLTAVDLVEYSFAARQVIANPEALTVSVKTTTLPADVLEMLWRAESFEEFKAVWTAAYINDLPDSAFAYIEPGGEKDDGGKTVPRSLRHFPHHDAGGAIDLPHLRNALARAPQSPFGSKALPHLERHAKAEGVGAAAEKTAHVHEHAQQSDEQHDTANEWYRYQLMFAERGVV